MKLNLLLTILLLLSFSPLKAQTIQVNNINDIEANYTPEDLIKKVLIDNSCTEVTDITSSVYGAPTNTQAKNYGYFKSKPGSKFPFKEGIVISTGRAHSIGETIFGNLDTPTTGKNDIDLSNSLTNTDLNDASFIEFDFVPKSDEISFRYLMASEEYQSNYPCNYADAFAFLLKKEGDITYNNLAVIPNTNIPVSVTNVHGIINNTSSGSLGCAANNENYFAGNNLGDTNFDGRTTVLTVKAKVIPNVKYHIKLVIADNGDNRYDSAVFLEKGSFNLGLNLGTDFSSSTNNSVCGTEKLLTSNITADSYQWYKDDIIIPSATTQNYTANLGNGKYTCKITNGTCTDEDDINLEFSEIPKNNTAITALFTCSDNLNTQINLSSKINEILAGQSNTKFEVLFYTDPTYTTPITTPNNYKNLTFNDIIYIRIRNKITQKCFVDTSFNSIITNEPTPQTPLKYEECDDIFNGTDTDGYFNNFLLNTKDAEILGALDPAIYNISYHTTLIGAQTDKNTDVINKNTPYRNAIINTQQVYVRVENKNNMACNNTSKTFNLVVKSLPVTNNIVELKQCDNDTDAFANFNLEEARSKVSANYLNETFIFYPSLNDAENNTMPILNVTAFSNRTATSDVIWVRTISNENCYKISQINLTVSTTGIPSSFQKTFNQCDDFLDINGNNNIANDDTDGVTSFDFSTVDAEIKALFTATGQQINVTYYKNEADALAEVNKITNTSNYRNIGYANTQKIYVRVDSDLDNDCLGFGAHITLNVNSIPIVQNVTNIELCDDFDSGAFNDGVNTNINLTDKVTDILGSTQQNSAYTITFHTNAADATSGNSPITNDTTYTNQTINKETIHVRVVNNNTGCFNDHLTFDIIINSLPIISNKIPALEICDTPTITDGNSRNGFAQNINLSERDVDVLNGRDPNLFEISYHNTLQNAINGSNPLPKTNYSNKLATTTVPPTTPLNDSPAIEIIYISLLNKNTGCRYGISKFQLIIHPEPLIPLNITDYIDCDNETDSNSDNTNGINGDITLKNKTLEILAKYPVALHSNYTISFHESLAGAKSGNTPINKNTYENTTNNQTIFVRVLNTKTSCVNTNLTFQIKINPLPDFMVDTPIIVCLNNPQTKLESINPNATYSYEWTLKGDPKILGTDAFYNIQKGGTYIITATMLDGTGCKRSKEIIVNESINPTLNTDDVVIVDDTNNNGLDSYAIKIITENKNLGIGNYQFLLIDEDGNQTSFQDEPLFENITGGIYTIVVNDKNGCLPDAILDVSVIEYPKFFTPNGDGYNDTWKIKGANSSFYPSSNITIVNRYGKTVAIIPIDNQNWNGSYKGKTLPSNDYWFKITLIDRKGKVHQHQGHFSLLRK
ncbi:choice-of-anchor L domain-containing protein [Tenacibaculum aestuariivivum]|uniref:choice-of-anchor L domain-containing protein n=1 Tax=Tenacibaculum aestuariivivum TaxID=2006131 RepID=UPI003AB2FAA4